MRHQGHVAGRDILVFSVYIVGFLTLPGTLAWRWLSRREGAPLIEDLVLGTVLGYFLELPVYVLCRAVGAPLLEIIWPLLVLGLTLGTSRGRELWSVRNAPRLPVAWSWTLAAILAFAMTWCARNVWSMSPVTRAALRAPYVDEPFHLALIGELRHHFPPQMPFVDGTPLYYHWLTYVHLASSSWLTGIDPIVLLKTLGLTAIVGVTILGSAVVTNRITGRLWPGLVVAAMLVLVTPLDLFGWTASGAPWAGERYLSLLLFIGPTQTFADLLFLPLLVLLVETLRDNRAALKVWVVIGLLFVGVGGAKSTFLPTLIAGLAGTLVLGLLLTRRLHRSTLILTVLSGVAFLVARMVFYGPGSRSLTWGPLATIAKLAATQPGLVDGSGNVPQAVQVIVGISYIVAQVAAGAGGVGLLILGGWRRPMTQFLFGSYAAAIGATLLLDHPASGQLYFLYSGTLTLLVLSGLGLAAMVPEGSGRRVGAASLVAAAVGALGAAATAAVTTHVAPSPKHGSPVAEAVRTFVVPQVVFIVLLALFALAAWLLVKRLGWPTITSLVLVVAALIGGGLIRSASDGVKLAQRPWPAVERGATVQIGAGGIPAARWLSDHSAPSELVATNAHCIASYVPHCDRRNFWIAGYSERHVLVEGWAYIAPETVGEPSNKVTNSQHPPFWDKHLLRENNRAFTHPSRASVDALRDGYGVTWLFVDLNYPVRLHRLEAVADLKYRAGHYAVLKVRG